MTIKTKDECENPEHYHKRKCAYYEDACEACIRDTKAAMDEIKDDLYFEQLGKARAMGKCHIRILK